MRADGDCNCEREYILATKKVTTPGLAARLFAVASWGLIGLFGVLTIVHVVLTVLF